MKPLAELNDLMTLAQLKAFMPPGAVGKNALYSEVASGKLVSVRVGQRILVTRQAVLRWLRVSDENSMAVLDA